MTADELKKVEELKAREKDIAAKIAAIKSGVEGLYPIIDGIIDVEKYVNAKYKILWILKEPHDEWVTVKETGQRRNGRWNIASGYSELTIDKIKKERKLLVAKRVMLATHKILPEAENALEALKSIAYINIKKIPGGSSSVQKEIEQAYNEHKDLLKEQIETYNPDIIICGNTLQYLSDDNYFPKQNRVELFSTPNGQFCYYALKDRLYINTYHPAIRENDEFWDKCIDGIASAVSDWKKIR
jgi:hypothetical protein